MTRVDITGGTQVRPDRRVYSGMEVVPLQCVACRVRYAPAPDETARCPRCGCVTWIAVHVLDAGAVDEPPAGAVLTLG